MDALQVQRLATAGRILEDYAAASGLTAAAPPRRYLWTDAFAVMTWIGLAEASGDSRYLELARRLIAQVHEVLGAHREDDAHPTARGLRIGKRLPQRGPDEPCDPELEWERDGQYYHYLTKWMHALRRMAAASGDARYRDWALALARAAQHAFVYPSGMPRAMYWKMSVDLSRPLVSSMGAHDPLEGLVESASLGLDREAQVFSRLCAGRRWATDDPLGAGGLLMAALQLVRLVQQGHETLQPHLTRVLADTPASVQAAAETVGGPAGDRLAFRELGLALGLHAVPALQAFPSAFNLERFVPLAAELEAFWLDPANQAAAAWIDHRDINAVMLAASLAPMGALG